MADDVTIMIINGERYVTPTTAARMIGITDKTIRNQLAAGVLQAIKPDGWHNYIAVSSVERYIAERAGQVGKYKREKANS